MGWNVFIFGVLPALIFVVLAWKSSLKNALIGAFIMACVEAVYISWHLGSPDIPSVFMVLSVGVLGYLSYKKNNDLFFKMQPALLNLILATFILYIQFFTDGIFARYRPALEAATPPEYLKIMSSPNFAPYFDGMITFGVGAILIHGFLIWFAAAKLPNVAWLLIRSVGGWVLLILSAVIYNIVNGGFQP